MDISSNKIKDITFDDVQNMPKVEFLSIENNPLTYLDETVLQLHHLSTLQIDMNDEIADVMLMARNVCVNYTGQYYKHRLNDIRPCGKRKGMVTIFLYEPFNRKK